MKITICFLLAISVAGFSVFLFPGSLEKIPVGRIEIRSGTTLRQVSNILEEKITASGWTWQVRCDSEIAMSVSGKHIFAGGNVKNVVWDIQNKFRCNTMVDNKRKLIYFYGNRHGERMNGVGSRISHR